MIQYTISASNCFLSIVDETNGTFQEFKLCNVRVKYDTKIFTIKDADTIFTIASGNLSTINTGAFTTFDGLYNFIESARIACGGGGGGGPNTYIGLTDATTVSLHTINTPLSEKLGQIEDDIIALAVVL